MTAGLLLTPALVTCGGLRAPVRGSDRQRIEVVGDGAVTCRDGTITYAGPASGLGERDRAGPAVRRTAGAVLPGFDDCHTHLPFFGWRADEFEARLAGKSYRDLHGGGGIYRSARMMSGASDEEVIEFCRPLTAEMLAHGTTALELKTGYGLSVEAELRQAGLARRLEGEIEQSCTVTLLASHAVPPGRTREEGVEAACEALIPSAVAEGLADAVDVYVEDIAFSIDDLERVADAGGRHGVPLRVHADQLGLSGAAEAACRLAARSADHLNHVSEEGIRALGRSGTIAVLL